MDERNYFTTFDSFYGFYDENPNIKNIVNFLRPSLDEFEKRVWAVHASNYLWPDAILKPYRRINGKMDKSEGINSTVHFSLGGLVAPHHGDMSWDDSLYAILTQLGNLISQLKGIYCYDSFINGMWKITSGSILIAPYDSISKEIFEQYEIRNCNIIYYDPNEINIREVITKTIKNEGGIRIELLQHQVIQGTPAYLAGKKNLNINFPEFSQSLFDEIDPNLYIANIINLLANMPLNEVNKFASKYPSLFLSSILSLLIY